MKDVAERAGVSIGTVSNVVNRPDLVSPATRARVVAAIAEVGFVRRESARLLRTRRSDALALLVLDLANPFFVEVMRGAEGAARAAGLGVVTCNSAHSAAEEANYLGLFAAQRVRGVLVTSVDATGGTLAAFARSEIPYVLVDRTVPGREACRVLVDDVAGGAMAVGHLAASGHRRIAFVSGPLDLPQCRDRLAGARKAAGEAGLAAGDVRVIEGARLDIEAGRDAAGRVLGLPGRPTAVFCANDLLALGVLQTLFAAGVRVPEEMAIVGYDDIEFAAAAAIPLSSIRQPAARIGQTAAELLIEETSSAASQHVHQAIVFQPEMVVRRSSIGRAGN
ncbi:LacI family transcriptional regulator [Catenulispora sp. GAS73]|uniref:LacI family DNA-binding transcriptional regulator n=1 Tax=Catenulispora sp. GAS73 TaxID=3156269 RepID=UPI0035134FC5